MKRILLLSLFVVLLSGISHATAPQVELVATLNSVDRVDSNTGILVMSWPFPQP